VIDQGDGDGDQEFFAEVDAFIASLPDDSARVQRIAARLPEKFPDVLRRREERISAGGNRELILPSGSDWNWGVIAASTAIAAALAGMVLIWLSGEPADPPTGQPVVGPAAVTGETEFVVTIHSDGEADMVAQSGRADLAEEQRDVAGMNSTPIDRTSAAASNTNQSWYLTAPSSPPLPVVSDPAWPRSAIDRFVLAALEKHGTRPVEDADRLTLLRRLSYDLTGLPPSPELVEHFLHNQSPAAYGSVVEELMATWQFGEHWASRWLQLAGYDAGEPELWRYREYVIAALNKDKPYDRFLSEQLAGDLMPLAGITEQAEARIGTGFLVTPGTRQAGAQVDRVMSALMGVDVARARAPLGKAPPLAKRDFLAMEGIFASTRIERSLDLRLDPDLYPPSNLVEDDRLRVESKRVRGLIASVERRLARSVERRERDRMRRLRTERANLRAELMVVESVTRDQIVSSGADYTGASDRRRPVAVGAVPRGLPSGLPIAGLPVPVPAAGQSGRLELAQWMVDPRHPLTARVFVDRVWGWLFGRSLLGGGGENGIAGAPPPHPELLDFLAVRFSSGGWSVKRLVREIVMSRAYQLSTAEGAQLQAAELRNERPWGPLPRDLSELEQRDAVVSVAGWLNPNAGWEQRMFARGRFGVIAGLEEERAYRALYLDAPEPVDGELIFQAALAASRRMITAERQGDPVELVRNVFMQTLAREPTSEESAWAVEVIGRARSLEDGGVLGSVLRPDRLGGQAAYLEGLLPRVTVRLEAGDRTGGGIVSWAMLYHALMMTEEFRRVR